MKSVRSIFIFLLAAFSLQAQDFSFSPQKPTPGEKITVKFNPGSQALPEDVKPELLVYLYNQDLEKTLGVDLKKDGENWTGSFTSDKKNLGALSIVKAGEIVFNNGKKGFVIPLYDKKGNLLPGNQAGLGYAYYSWATYYLEFDRYPQLAYELMAKDFENNPSIKTDFVELYVPVFSAIDKQKMQDYLREGTSLLEKKKTLTEDDYSTIVDYFNRLNDTTNANRYENLALEKFPQGTLVQMKEASRIAKITGPDEKLTAVKNFGNNYPESRFLPGLHSPIIKGFLEKAEYLRLEKFLEDNKRVVNSYYFQNSALKIIEKGGSTDIALSIASKGVDRVKAEIKKEKQPEYLSDKQWKESKDQNLGQSLYAKGRILYELNRKDEAYEVLKEAASKTGFQEPMINYYYAKTLTDKEEFGAAFDQLSEFIKSGNSTPEMAGLLETAYVKMKGNTNGFSLFLSGLEKEANKKIAAKLRNEIINEPAPDFKLVDLEGQEVSLGDFKGKVVIVDFWATWCGPCLSSFPGMKKAVEKYSNDENVKFLFLNTSERVEDKKQNAADFVSKNNYPFHVLLDTDSKVRESYKVTGIPTKFIIDKNGNIRFKSLGFSGNTEKMVSELVAMITLLSENSSI